MSDPIKPRLAQAIKEAMRARDTVRLGTLRLLQAAIQQKEVDERNELDEATVLAIVERQVKQRRESIEAFEKAGRTESAQKEQAELAVLQEFMPKAADPAEVTAVIDAAIAEVRQRGITGGAAMGQVMGIARAALAGRADMGAVSAQVRQKLADSQ